MSHHLPHVSHLMSGAWHQFTRDWRLTAGISLWFLIPAGLSILHDTLQFTVPFIGSNNDSMIFSLFFFSLLITIPMMVLNVIIYLLTPIRLYRLMLKRDTEHPDANTAKSPWPWDLFGPFLWIGILLILIFWACFMAGGIVGSVAALIAHFGFHASRIVTAITGLGIGFLAVFLPAIYFGTLFSQSVFVLIEDGIHGTGALRQSARLVHGRWWGVFGRLFLNKFILCLIMGAVFAIVFALTAFFIWTIGGFAFSNLGDLFRNLDADLSASPGLLGIIFLFGLIMTILPVALQICIIPYFMTYPVKLFHALKGSR